MKRIFHITIVLPAIIIVVQSLQSHTKSDYELIGNALHPKLSDYGIYLGNAGNLSPSDGFVTYSPASGLFTDYAEKQRLVKIPNGTKIKAAGDGLPEFPAGTMMVKTVYYDRTEKGRTLIETRVMINTADGWAGGTYKWNDAQTEAFLIEKGEIVPIAFIDDSGRRRSVNYEIPKEKDCAKCHKSRGDLKPLGFKIRNLNHGRQLSDLMDKGVIEKADISKFTQVPDWKDTKYSLEERARAYLDANCAHCHSDGGYCSIMGIRLGYELPIEKTRIKEKSAKILKLMSKKKMPYKSTTIIDDEGLDLIKQYVKTLE